MHRLIGTGYRELNYRETVFRKLRERGIEITDFLSNHEKSDVFRCFQSWFFANSVIFSLPDKLDADGCSNEVVVKHERIAEMRIPFFVQETVGKLKELNLLPQPKPEVSPSPPEDSKDVAENTENHIPQLLSPKLSTG